MKPTTRPPLRRLTVSNRQRVRRVDLPWLRRLTRALLEARLGLAGYHLDVHLLEAAAMIRLNETFLHHAGSTDVITFDYREPARPETLHGEVFVCVAEAVRQARRFRVPWQRELARYVVHGVLHLQGYDDQRAPAKRRMKRAENRLVRALCREFNPARRARA